MLVEGLFVALVFQNAMIIIVFQGWVGNAPTNMSHKLFIHSRKRVAVLRFYIDGGLFTWRESDRARLQRSVLGRQRRW